MLGKTAGGLFWMFRYLERSENIARLLEAGSRMALTRSTDAESEWKSVITTAAVRTGYDSTHDSYTAANVVDYLLREKSNGSSVLSITKNARDNARLVRTALTTEVWTAVNDTWMILNDLLRLQVKEADLPSVLNTIRQQSALMRGALHGTMLRNDIYDFARLGTFVERADNTARIIDVKYYTLLPSASYVGSRLDNVQWEMILRSVSAHRAFRWLDEEEMNAQAIARFLILDKRLPRSLMFCSWQIVDNLASLEKEYGHRRISHDLAEGMYARLRDRTIEEIFEDGLHEFISGFLQDNNALGRQIENDFRFSA